MASILLVLFALGTGSVAGADDVAEYLARHGLRQLLALHLEERLKTLEGEEKNAVALELAELYASLLEEARDVSWRVDLEDRSRELLALVPEESADELRLALLRGSYSAAERMAENHRLRQGEEGDVARIEVILSEAAPEFAALRRTLSDKAEAAERRRDRAGGVEQARLAAEAQRFRGLHARCTFLQGWTLYYLSFVTGREEHARTAMDLFGLVLDPEARNLLAGEVSRDLLANEAMARTALGLALCVALTEGADRAESWFALLEGEQVFEDVRASVPGWRLAVTLEEGEFRAARAMLEDRTGDSAEEVPVALVRLAAVHALEAPPGEPDAAELARWAIAELAAGGELSQVLDLATRYGVEALGETGFASLYVRGARAYQEARMLHGDDTPTARAEPAALYEEAAARLSEAITQQDAARFPVAAAGARSLIGWCHYFRGQFFSAREAFEAAAEVLPPAEAPEALWMAIVSLDRVARAEGGEAYELQLASLIATFLDRFPTSEYAPRLVLRQTETGERPSMARVEELLAIPASSEAFDAAQSRATDMLFTLFKDAAGDRKREIGERFLAIGAPMLSRARLEDVTSDEAARSDALLTARRILEVALDPTVQRATAAAETLARLDELDLLPTGAEPIRLELVFRRLQLALLDGKAEEAEGHADTLWDLDSSSAWARAGVRLVFRDAVDAWRAVDSSAADERTLARVIRYGGRALHEFDERDASLIDETVLSYYATVAEATLQAWEQQPTEELGAKALLLYERLLEVHPTNAIFLRAVGILAAPAGEVEKALDCWRRLAAGIEQGTEAWFEAKWRLIDLLATTDPARAREVMDQHRALYPEYGPEPWGTRLKAMDATLPARKMEDESPAGEKGSETG